MKKFLTTLAIIAVSAVLIPTSHAGDCFQDPIYDRDWNAEVTTGAFIRDVACMEGSEIIVTLPVGTIIHVIAETDGWYKIETNDGVIGWVGQWLVKETSAGFDVVEEPVEEYLEEETTKDHYDPMFDISEHEYEDAIWYVYNNEIVNGYEDGAYKPDKTVNRAELLKIIVESAYENEFDEYKNTNCFSDVPSDEWYTKYVCFAKNEGIVEGYEGNKFKPNQDITFVEALKITLVGFKYNFEEASPWYQDVVMEASDFNFIPLDVERFHQDFSRGQMAELITRILKFEDEELEDYLGDSADEVITYEDLN